MPQEKMVEDPSARRVVNTLEGTTNIVDMEKQRSKLMAALEMCESSLAKHCGPTSGYAMLVDAISNGLEFNPNIYTKDGIQILSAIEFLSPLETYIKDLITYVGGRVDSVAKDGTTTSMLLTTKVIKRLLELHDTWHKINLNSNQIAKIIVNILDEVIENLKKYSFTVDGLVKGEVTEEQYMKIGGLVAFMQAMSSSGGNVELANAMYEIFSKSPKVTWERISYYNSIKESKDPFMVEVDKFDSKFRCILAGDNVMNTSLGTEYLVEDADIFCYPDAINDVAMKTDQLLHFLREYPDDKPLLIISTYISGAVTTLARDLNTNRKNKISLWQYSPEERLSGMGYPWELFIFCAIAGIRPYCLPDIDTTEDIDDRFIIHAKKVHYHDTYMEVYGIVDMDEGSCLHPYYAKRNTEEIPSFYKEVLEGLEKQLSLYAEGNKKEGVMYGLFLTMLNALVTVHRPTLRLGGTTHEQLSNISVIQDVQGATMSSLNNGFTVAGPIVLAAAVSMTIQEYTEKTAQTSDESMVRSLVFDALMNSILEMCKYVYEPELYDYLVNGIVHEEPILMPKGSYWNSLYSKDKKGVLVDYMDDIDEYRTKDPDEHLMNYPVLQPLKIYEELLKRLKELMPKLALTNEIIVGGGVVMQDKDKKDQQ